MIHPYISYGILAWGNASQSIMKQTIILQKRAIRVINGAGYNSHTEPLFKKSQILKLNDLYEQEVVLFMFKYMNKKLPLSFDRTFIKNHEIQNNYSTRRANLIYIERCDSSFASRLPLYLFPKIWNKWCDRSLGISYNQLKRKYKNSIFASYTTAVKCNNPHCKECRTK